MKTTTLIVPGYRGSGPQHWQSWLESRIEDSHRVTGIDWDSPELLKWAEVLSAEIAKTTGKVRIVAHSFGCLASAVAIQDWKHKIAGVLFVAPATPRRFTLAGPIQEGVPGNEINISASIPYQNLDTFGVLVASRDDPWMPFEEAQSWANSWGLATYDAGFSGHINEASGHGAWPDGEELLNAIFFATGIKKESEFTLPFLKSRVS